MKKRPTKKLTKKQLNDFKKLIIKRKGEMLDDIRHMSENTLRKSQKDNSGDISGYTYHMADVATDTYDREFSMGIASNERQLLYEVDEALKKIKDGTYGICEDCEKIIPKTRLKAIPYVKLCLKCQKEREKR